MKELTPEEQDYLTKLFEQFVQTKAFNDVLEKQLNNRLPFESPTLKGLKAPFFYKNTQTRLGNVIRLVRFRNSQLLGDMVNEINTSTAHLVLTTPAELIQIEHGVAPMSDELGKAIFQYLTQYTDQSEWAAIETAIKDYVTTSNSTER